MVPPESEEDALRRQTRRQMRARRLMAYRIQQAELAADGGYAAAIYSPYPTFGKIALDLLLNILVLTFVCEHQ